jgi:hypothetical protein
MTAQPFIAAFDVATATGVCDGACGDTPRVFTWYLDDAGKERARKLCYFRRLLDRYFAENHAIEAVYYEAPLNSAVMMQIGSSDDVIALLRGSIGVLEASAVHAGIQCVEPLNLQSARQALTGQRTFARVKKGSRMVSTAKDVITATAKSMGVTVATDHEADAYAVWFYACALHNPRIAHVSQPLFAR